MRVSENMKLGNWLWLGMFVSLMTNLSCASKSDDSSDEVDDSGNADVAKMELARQLLQSNQTNKAMDLLIPWSRKEPQNKEVQLLLGLTYLAGSYWEPALTQFQKAYDLSPSPEEKSEILLNQSMVLIVLKKYQQANDKLHLILKSNQLKEVEKVYNNIGLTFFEQNQCNKAMPWFKKAIIANPQFGPSHYNMGVCATKARKFNQAVDYFKEAKQSCYDCLKATTEYLKSIYLAGRKNDALEELKKYQRLVSQPESLKELDKLKKEFENSNKK